LTLNFVFASITRISSKTNVCNEDARKRQMKCCNFKRYLQEGYYLEHYDTTVSLLRIFLHFFRTWPITENSLGSMPSYCAADL